MQAVIRKWGNSAAVRLSAAALEEAGYALEQPVELVVSRGRIVIQPATRTDYTLDELVRGISADNVHDEVSTGLPVGREAL